MKAAMRTVRAMSRTKDLRMPEISSST